jgi:hypothetical protein
MGIAAILLTPLVAMQFTDQVRWTGFDFAVAGGLLIGAVAIYEIAARFVLERRQRILVGGVLALVVLLFWAEGPVGTF